MDDINPQILAQRNEPLEEPELHALRGRVGRKVQDQQSGSRLHARQIVLQPFEHRLCGAAVHRNALHLRACDHRPKNVDGIAGIRHRNCIFVIEHSKAEVRNAFLRADRNDRLGLGIEVHVISRLVPVADGSPEPRNTAGQRVAMRRRALCRLDQLVDNVLRRGAIGVAHPEVDDVLAPLACRGLQLACDVEDIRRQPCQPSKFFHTVCLLLSALFSP